MYKLSAIANVKNTNPVKFYMLLTFAAYIFIYSIFLYLSDFLPYVFDNNETYSSLVHAYNMYFGDWSQHFGLADEAFSPDPAAHPVIHTHQGNWPRLLAYILFALGARSAESQISIHVFTVGLLAIWLMYRFFAKAANYKFAAITCLIFMTDYMLFAQWQVVTYRIWHVFFVFSSLNCMQEIDGNKRVWKYFFIANFVALFYWELVFAFYVSVWALLYYAYLVSWNFKKIFKRGLLIAMSGTISLIILATQLSLFMGFKNVVLDYYYTFFARNANGNELELKIRMQEFYSNMNVVFWYNIVDASKLREIKIFIQYIFTYGFQAHTPIIALYSFVAVVSLIFINIQSKLNKKFGAKKALKIPAYVAKISIAISLFFVMELIFVDNKFLGVHPVNELYKQGKIILIMLSPIFSWILATLIFNISNPFNEKFKVSNLILMNIFVLCCSALIVVMPSLYYQHQSIIWLKCLSLHFPIWVWQLLLFFTIYCGLVNIALGRDLVKQNFKTESIWAFIYAALLAYTFVFMLTPGYVYSGYLLRTAPFIVFFVDVIMALFFWFLLESIILQFNICKIHTQIWRPISSNYLGNIATLAYNKIILRTIAICLLSVIGYQWFYNQYFYYKIFPPTSFGFIKQLRRPEMIGKSIITNQYPLPFAYEAQTWSYNGSNFGAGTLVQGHQGFSMPHKIEYLWYRNRNTFADYKTPDYYVCFTPHTMEEVSNELKMHTIKSRRCSSNRIVNQAALATKFVEQDLRLRHQIIVADDSNNDAWAIIKMDWEFPPHFAKSNRLNYFNTKFDKNNRMLTINYSFKQQNGTQELESKFKIVLRNKGTLKTLGEVSGVGGAAIVQLPQHIHGSLEIIGTPYTKYKTGPSITEFLKIIG